jgi:uncharacterized membrane protein YjfL (UPF0719 family)
MIKFLRRCAPVPVRRREGFFLTLLVIGLLSVPAFSLDTLVVSKSGRRIQLDGFLLDWTGNGRYVWRNSNGWVWDAVNTPEGLAGYFHCGMIACSSWTMYADLHRLKTSPWRMTLGDSAQSGDAGFKAIRMARDTMFSITFEWVIPWDSVTLDSNGVYAVPVAAESGCGDTLDPFLIVGSRDGTASALPPWFAGRVALIVVLLVAFIALQLTMRKKTRRRGSLRRSA